MSKANAHRAAPDIQEGLGRIKDDVTSLAGSFVDRGKEAAGALRDSVKERVTSSAEALDEYVQKSPRQAVLLAFGAGFLAAFLLRRR